LSKSRRGHYFCPLRGVNLTPLRAIRSRPLYPQLPPNTLSAVWCVGFVGPAAVAVRFKFPLLLTGRDFAASPALLNRRNRPPRPGLQSLPRLPGFASAHPAGAQPWNSRGAHRPSHDPPTSSSGQSHSSRPWKTSTRAGGAVSRANPVGLAFCRGPPVSGLVAGGAMTKPPSPSHATTHWPSAPATLSCLLGDGFFRQRAGCCARGAGGCRIYARRPTRTTGDRRATGWGRGVLGVGWMALAAGCPNPTPTLRGERPAAKDRL